MVFVTPTNNATTVLTMAALIQDTDQNPLMDYRVTNSSRHTIITEWKLGLIIQLPLKAVSQPGTQQVDTNHNFITIILELINFTMYVVLVVCWGKCAHNKRGKGQGINTLNAGKIEDRETKCRPKKAKMKQSSSKHINEWVSEEKITNLVYVERAYTNMQPFRHL